MQSPRYWQKKLHTNQQIVVKPVPCNIAGMKIGQIMLVPTAKLIDDFIRLVPFGHQLDIPSLRRRLAQAYDSQVTCPITTGFHMRTVAEAAYEDYLSGTSLESITPVWRVLSNNAPTSKKLSFYQDFIAPQRKKECLF